MVESVRQVLAIAEAVRAEADRDDRMGILYAAKYILANVATGGVSSNLVIDEKVAKSIVMQFVQSLLEEDHFEAAATVLWGPGVYDWRPQSAQDTWRCLFDYDKLLVQGAGAMGKTFNAAAWFLLDWMRDPEYTCIKVVSLTEAHAQRNVFAAIKTFYRTALVKPECSYADGPILLTSTYFFSAFSKRVSSGWKFLGFGSVSHFSGCKIEFVSGKNMVAPTKPCSPGFMPVPNVASDTGVVLGRLLCAQF